LNRLGFLIRGLQFDEWVLSRPNFRAEPSDLEGEDVCEPNGGAKPLKLKPPNGDEDGPNVDGGGLNDGSVKWN
jgi:hypothetical protein